MTDDLPTLYTLYADEALDHDLLTFEEEQALFRRYEAGDRAAREEIITANLKMVVGIARKWYGQGVPFPDLIQEGNLGLMTAVEKFDWRRGNRFSTCAYWWIRQAVSRAVYVQARSIRLPVHINETIVKAKRTGNRLAQQAGNQPTIDELIEEMGLNGHVADTLRQHLAPIGSLDETAHDDSDTEIYGFVPDELAPHPEAVASRSDLRCRIDELLLELPPRQARVLAMRLGLNGRGETMTLKQVSERFGLTRERIRQIEAEALECLRHTETAQKLRDFLEE